MILSFSDFLQKESFDSSPVKWRKKNENEYWFQIDELIYDVTFDDSSQFGVEISFTVDLGPGSQKMIGMSGTGNQFTVLSTVMAIWKDFMSSHPSITHYKFIANKTQSSARASVYERLIKKYFSEKDWTFHKEDSSRETEFHLFKK